MTHVRAHTHMSVCASITKAILFEILDNCSLPQVTHLNSPSVTLEKEKQFGWASSQAHLPLSQGIAYSVLRGL